MSASDIEIDHINRWDSASDDMHQIAHRCRYAKLRFTKPRRRVLEMLSGSNRALGAYELLGYLEEAGYGSKPPTVYRALQFLIQHGFAHKIERLNAFVACTHPGEPHSPAFLICRSCNRVIEAYAPPAKSVLGKQVRAAGFRIEGTVVEAVGLCPRCIEEERKCA